MNKIKGFTLMELMIVVSIIGIIAAIAIPTYQLFINRSRVTVALQEINNGKVGYELLVNQNYAGLVNNTNSILPSTTSECTITINTVAQADGSRAKAIKCSFSNVAVLGAGAEIYLDRDANGKYTCHTENMSSKYTPKQCIAH